MRILVVGKGGREHALAKKLEDSPLCGKLWVVPGNSGMKKAGVACHPAERPEEILAFALKENIDLAVLGPETAILSELKEILESQGIRVFAPSRRAALLESSKRYCKEILAQAQVPTAKFKVAFDLDSAMELISVHDFSSPLVLKADGLAQGKGVVVASHREKAAAAARELSDNYGFPLLLEECLIGRELSAFALCDGEEFLVLGTACDYKRISRDPFSANTGGMGAYSPCDFLTDEDEEQIKVVFARTLQTMKDSGVPFQGFLFAGLMKTKRGIEVIEFNVRMGDPETQALLPRIKTDLLDLIDKAFRHQLSSQSVEVFPQSAIHVVLVSQGYPERTMSLGHPLTLPPKLQSEVYFAGVADKNDFLVNSGGRVLGVTALASSRGEAREIAYRDVAQIHFEGCYCREDIGL